MNERDLELFNRLSSELSEYVNGGRRLPGLADSAVKEVFVRQLIDSVKRVKYALTLSNRAVGQVRSDPSSDLFDPLKAAVYHMKNGNLDEAVWLVFLATHFGKSKDSRWLLVGDFYLGAPGHNVFSWERVSNSLSDHQEFINNLYYALDQKVPRRKFSNHRKYESLRPNSKRSLYKVISSYRDFIANYGDHRKLFDFVICGGCKYKSFETFYALMGNVLSFGRTARFDFLTMLGKLKILDIEPQKTYMVGATGPLRGAKLLYGMSKSSAKFECDLFELSLTLSINPFGMQVLEDALCNWQKNPKKYIYFSG